MTNTGAQVGDYVADTIAAGPPDEIQRALALADVASGAIARSIGKAAHRDAAVALVRAHGGRRSWCVGTGLGGAYDGRTDVSA